MRDRIGDALHSLNIFLESIFRVFNILIIGLHRHLPIFSTLNSDRVYVGLKGLRIIGESI